MTKNKIWIIVLAIVLVGLTSLVVVQYQTPKVAVVTLPSPTPSPLPSESSEQISPDGTHTVKLKKSGKETEIMVNGQMVESMSGSEFTIPFNTWSPDNKYFFLKEKKESRDEYLLYSATGKAFPSGEVSLAIIDLFTKVYPENTVVEVTGWAAPTLLILNAKSENEASMSFWFDVQTRKFIRLSSYFY